MKNQHGFTVAEILDVVICVGMLALAIFLIKHCNWFLF